jgi:hypothetical protein
MISNSQTENESKINVKKYSEIEFIAARFFGHVYKVKNNETIAMYINIKLKF